MDLMKPVVEMASFHPDLWNFVEENVPHYHANGTQDYFLPTHAFMAFADLAIGINDNNLLEHSAWAAEAAILTPWRYSQRVYNFDEDLFYELTSKSNVGNLPVDTLNRIPDWSIYLKFPEPIAYYRNPNDYFKIDQAIGAWVRVGDDICEELRVLYILFHLDTGDTIIQSLALDRDCTIEDSIRKYADKFTSSVNGGVKDKMQLTDEMVQNFVDSISPVLPLILFLCTDEPEVVDLHVPLSERLTYRRSRKHGTSLKSPKRPRQYEVGRDFGNAIRRFKYETTQARESGVTPHIRRAHWHTFVKGPRKDPKKQKRILKWIPPLMVGVKDQ